MNKNKILASTNRVYSFVDWIVRLFFFIASKTLAKLADFFFTDDFGVVIVRCTRIVGGGTSSIKSNSKFLLALQMDLALDYSWIFFKLTSKKFIL